jgi:hybrid cluster-associated redox disulfide protein
MNQVITKDMTFNQLLQMHPDAAKILANFNLGCVGCLGASTETLAQGARAHGLDIEELLAALNERSK